MIKNYLTVALRNLHRHAFYSFLNVLRLAVGVACALLAVLYVDNQFTYDAHHEKRDRIYRVIREATDNEGVRFDAGTHPMAPAMKKISGDRTRCEDVCAAHVGLS